MDFTFEFRDLASHSTHKSSVLDILLVLLSCYIFLQDASHSKIPG